MARLYLVLLIMGAGWGMTVPLAKYVISSGYEPFGIIFWNQGIGVVLLGAMLLWRRARRAKNMPAAARAGLRGTAFGGTGPRGTVLRGKGLRLIVFVALLGTLAPSLANYAAARHLPAGILALIISLAPIMSFPIALGLSLERFTALRLGGLLAGLVGVLLIILPEASLPAPGLEIWVLVALLAPLCYGFEGNVISLWGTEDLGPAGVLFGASLVGVIVTLPLALMSGQFIVPSFPLPLAAGAIVLSSALNVLAYAAYVWLVGAAGPVFAVQVSYSVTGFGILWSMLLLSERYAPTIWLAFALMLLGVALVQPRDRADAGGAGAP